jgi:hypothetical protein
MQFADKCLYGAWVVGFSKHLYGGCTHSRVLILQFSVQLLY